ncbi:MAG: rod-binding protein, partial [Burkholderiaceae bacterium]|nr:rod-binding protein [Burkholderiaceae bacterium]
MSFHYIPRPQGDTTSNFDFSHLNSLKKGVRAGADAPQDKNREVAHQFEALMIQQLMKQARQTALESGPFDSQQTRLAQSLGDEQMALQLSNPGLGLAQNILDQIQASQGGPRTMAKRGELTPELGASRLRGLRSSIG